MSIDSLVEKVIEHLQIGPADKPGQFTRNNFSPNAPDLIKQVFRGHLLAHAEKAIGEVGLELESLSNIMPESIAEHIKLSQARINAIIRNLAN